MRKILLFILLFTISGFAQDKYVWQYPPNKNIKPKDIMVSHHDTLLVNALGDTVLYKTMRARYDSLAYMYRDSLGMPILDSTFWIDTLKQSHSSYIYYDHIIDKWFAFQPDSNKVLTLDSNGVPALANFFAISDSIAQLVIDSLTIISQDVDTIRADVVANTTSITINANGIATNVSNITTNANGITSNYSGIQTNATNISQNATDISLNASAILIANDTLSQHNARINVNASEISSTVIEVGLNRDTININKSTIVQNADNINLRVEKNDVINQINISTEGIDIEGDNIQLTGNTTVDGTFRVNENAIIGTKLQVGTGSGVYIGDDVISTSDGIAFSLNDYWLTTGDFRVGGNNGLRYSTGSGLIQLGSNTVIDGNATVTGSLASDTQTATEGWTISQDGTAIFNHVLVKTASGSEIDWQYVENVSITNADIANVSADKITAGTITGSTVQTASSGKRVALSTGTNGLEFYSSGGTLSGTIEGGATGGWTYYDATQHYFIGAITGSNYIEAISGFKINNVNMNFTSNQTGTPTRFWGTNGSTYGLYTIPTSTYDYWTIQDAYGTNSENITDGTIVEFLGSNGLSTTYSATYNTMDISHSTAAGYKHIPSGGSSGQVLGYGGSSGTATWTTPSSGWNGSATSDLDMNGNYIFLDGGNLYSGSSTSSFKAAIGGTSGTIYAEQFVNRVSDTNYSGITTTFTDADGYTIVVKGGIITDKIAP